MGSARVLGLDELGANIDKLRRLFGGSTLNNVLLEGGLVVEREAKINVRKRGLIDTSNLRRSIAAEVVRDGVVLIGTGVIYAAIHEFGGTIKAKRAPYLVFRTKSGQWVKVKQVRIPARPYLRPAFDENKELIIETIRIAAEDALGSALGLNI